MNIGIFGDSFADEIIFKDRPGLSWVEYLRTAHGKNVTCFAMAGSSLYYSYDLFKKNHIKFDKVVFVATAIGRLTIPSYINFKDESGEYLRHINTLDTAIAHLSDDNKHKHTEESYNATKAAAEYYKYLYDSEKEKSIYKLIIDDIFKIRPDTIMLYLHKDFSFNDNPGLVDISVYEMQPYGYDKLPIQMDYRKCHISEVNNSILADKVNSWIHGEQQVLSLNDFLVPSKEEIDSKVEFKLK